MAINGDTETKPTSARPPGDVGILADHTIAVHRILRMYLPGSKAEQLCLFRASPLLTPKEP